MTNAKTLEAIAELKAGKGKRHCSVSALMADMNDNGRTRCSFQKKLKKLKANPTRARSGLHGLNHIVRCFDAYFNQRILFVRNGGVDDNSSTIQTDCPTV